MATTIKLKNSVTTTNAPSSLVQGEVAINITDKKVWVGNAATTPIQLLGDGGSASFTSIAFGAGTVSSPSITFTGDTNTGIYSPAADTIAFTEGGVESMRIDSSGNVGIGTNSPATKLVVKGTHQSGQGIINIIADSGTRYSTLSFTNNTTQKGIVFHDNTDSMLDVYGAAGQGLRFTTNDAERMRIDSSGNVGIGTSSPSYPLQVVKNANGAQRVLFSNNSSGSSAETVIAVSNGTAEGSIRVAGTAYSGYGAFAANNTLIYNDTSAITIMADNASNGVIKFATGSNSERMRIATNGDVGIGNNNPQAKVHVGSDTTAPGFGTSSQMVYIIGANQPEFLVRQTTNSVVCSIAADNTGGYVRTATNHPLQFSTNNTERMRITSGGEVYIAGTTDQGAYNLQCNGTGVWGAGAYVNGSDERIKDNIAPLDSGLDVVAKLNPVTYKYKENWSKDQSTQTGFIAQELLTVLDGKNYVDGVVQQGGEYMSVAYQNIIPILTKAIQEQQAMIEELKQEVAKLKGV